MIRWSLILLAALSEKEVEEKRKEDAKWYKKELEKEVRVTPTLKQEKKVIEKTFEEMQKELAPIRDSAPKQPTLAERMEAGTANFKNMARNAIDNTIGLGIAKVQNFKTKRHFKKNPESKEQIGYLMHGLFQNEGSQWRLARDLRKAGHQPYHLKGNHGLPRKESVQKAYDQIEAFHKATGMKNPGSRNDYFSGHSSGADVGVYMAADYKTQQYGIQKIQARAPAPTGLKTVTFGQKLLLPFANDDNTNTYHGRRSAVQLSKRSPKIPVQVVAGRYDGLVRPVDAAYKQASAHYFIDDKASTHFGTSGGNKDMNRITIDLLNKQEKRYVQEYQEA
ncbi:MAG: hypothetical protein ABH828_04690 [archaeon]